MNFKRENRLLISEVKHPGTCQMSPGYVVHLYNMFLETYWNICLSLCKVNSFQTQYLSVITGIPNEGKKTGDI